jgi:hypothetical protein
MIHNGSHQGWNFIDFSSFQRDIRVSRAFSENLEITCPIFQPESYLNRKDFFRFQWLGDFWSLRLLFPSRLLPSVISHQRRFLESGLEPATSATLGLALFMNNRVALESGQAWMAHQLHWGRMSRFQKWACID